MPQDEEKKFERRRVDTDLGSLHSGLTSLTNQVKLLEDKTEETNNKVEAHIADEKETTNQMLNAINNNTKTVADLATSVSTVVTLQRDLEGVVHVGKSIQSIIIWIGKVGALGGVIVYTAVDLFSKLNNSA